MKKYDSIILGFGKGGKTLAAYLAKKGEKVALVERSKKMYGGTCINVGCIPSKSLVTSAAEAALYSEASFSDKAQRYAAAIAEKRRVTSLLREKNYAKLNDLENVTVYDGVGCFVSDKEIEITDEKGEKLTAAAEKIFINTGSESILPSIPGIERNPHVYTSATLMEEEHLPRRLALIGAGYIGMEFASLYANFGSEVTVFQGGEVFLPREDRDIADEIRSIQEHHGVRFELGSKIQKIDGETIHYTAASGEKRVLQADAILLATGRKAAVADLHPENAGLKLTERGAVEVDDFLRTSVPGIWALGDVNGGPQFTFISLDDFRIIRSQLEGGSYDRSKRGNTAYSVFMDTPLGRVGLTEQEAISKGLPIRIVKLSTAAVPKAQVLRKTEGFLKAVIHAETGEILGVSLLCPEAYELVNTVKLAMDMGATADTLRDMIYSHPTMTEAFNDLFSL